MPKPYEPRSLPLNKELEKALKTVKQFEGLSANRKQVIEAVGWESISCLGDAGLIVHTRSDKNGDVDHIELTIDGRNYFPEKRRRRMERYGTVVVGGIIGGVFTIAGVVVGYLLAAT